MESNYKSNLIIIEGKMAINHCCICRDNHNHLYSLIQHIKTLTIELKNSQWKTKIHLSGCDCKECENVDYLVKHSETLVGEII